MKYRDLVTLNERFNKSTNILLDDFKCDEFIKTASLNEVLEKVSSPHTFNSFSLIGPFGSGKSTILLYLEKYFKGECGSDKNYLIIKILGEYDSFVKSFNKAAAKYVDVEESVIKTLKSLDKYAKKEYDGFVLLIDELGKFIDFSVENLNSDIYELQNVAEFVNKSNNYLFVSLHKSFNDYKIPFSEWNKIQGRFEHILMRDDYSEVIKLLKLSISSNEKKSKSLIKKIIKHYDLDETFIDLSPLHPFSVIALSELFNKYFQNQRTLFSFLFSAEKYAFREFLENEPPKLYNLANLYDYVNYLLKVYNVLLPDKEAYYLTNLRLEENLSELEKKIIKVIGLIHSFKLVNLKSDTEGIVYSLIDEYEKDNINKAIQNLLEKNLIIYQESSKSYALIENSNININKELQKRLNNDYDYKEVLSKFFKTLEAKKFFVEYGNKVEFQESFETGEFRVVYSTKYMEVPENSVLVIYENEDVLKELAKKIAALNDIQKEFVLSADTKEIIKNMISDTLITAQKYFSSSLKKIVYGKEYEYSYKKLQEILSDIAKKNAYNSLIINNYTLTHTNKKATITNMLKKLFIAMMQNADKENLGIEKYPPEKALYLSVIKPAGFHKFNGKKYYLSEPENLNFDVVFNEIKDYFKNKNNVSEFVEKLKTPPFMMKELISLFALNLFLIVNKYKVHLYREGNFVFDINIDILLDMIKQPKKYELEYVVLSERELEIFNAYLSILNESAQNYDNEKSIKVIKAIYSRFKKLPNFAFNTKNLSNKAKELRSALLSIRDVRKGFFEDIVEVVGFKNSNQFVSDFRRYFNEIVLSFEKMQKELKETLEKEFALIDKNIDSYEKEERLLIKYVINSDIEALSFMLMKKSLKDFYDIDVIEFKKRIKQKALDILNKSDLNITDKIVKKIVIYEKEAKKEKLVIIDKEKEKKLKNEIEELKKRFKTDELAYILSELLEEKDEKS